MWGTTPRSAEALMVMRPHAPDLQPSLAEFGARLLLCAMHFDTQEKKFKAPFVIKSLRMKGRLNLKLMKAMAHKSGGTQSIFSLSVINQMSHELAQGLIDNVSAIFEGPEK
jgi:hypothetical protein